MRVFGLLALVGLFAFEATPGQARSSTGDRLLVLREAEAGGEEYQLFWNSLEARGYVVTQRLSNAPAPLLTEHDESAFDHLLLFAPTAKTLPVDLSPQRLYNFLERSGNILLVLSPQLSELWRDFAREFAVDFDDRETRVVDHFQFHPLLDDGSHTTLSIPLDATPAPIISATTRRGPPVVYRGIAHSVGPLPLSIPILRASTSAYSIDREAVGTAEDVFVSGTAVTLVSALQAKNNARITFVGSMDLFSDEYASTSDDLNTRQTGNAAFARDLTAWTFQESGVLRVNSVRHSRVSDDQSRPLYRVGEKLEYSIDVAHYDSDRWQPYLSDDIQLDFVMLDPYLRLSLSNVTTALNSTRFSSQFTAPDAHGVFSLRVDYRRSGWNFLDEKSVISITPLRHDEYPRFVTGAIPYYTSAIGVSLAFIIFVAALCLQ